MAAQTSNIARGQRYIPETTLGETPTAPAWLPLSFSTFDVTATEISSEEFDVGDRGQRTSTVVSGHDVDVSASGTMRHGDHDGWLASLLQGSWYNGRALTSPTGGRPQRGSAIASASGGTVADDQVGNSAITVASVTGEPRPLQTVTINSRAYTLLFKPDGTAYGTAPTELILDRPLEAQTGSQNITWGPLPDVLVNGEETSTFSSAQNLPQGDAGDDSWRIAVGLEPVASTLTFPSRAPVNLDLTLIGRDRGDPVDTLPGTLATAVPGQLITTGVGMKGVAFIGRSGNTHMTGTYRPVLENITVSHTYVGRDRQAQVVSSALAGIARGGYQPTITTRAYVGTNEARFQAAANNNEHYGKLIGPFGFVDGMNYMVYFPDIQFFSNNLEPGATGSSIKTMEQRPNIASSAARVDPYGDIRGTVVIVRNAR